MKRKSLALAELVTSMVIWSTLGFCRQRIDLPSGAIAMVRGFIGAVFLALVLLLSRRRPDFKCIVRHAPILLLSGAFIGTNWIFLFEAYKYTTVAIASLSYYMEPVVLTVGAVLFFKERLSALKAGLLGVSVFGIVLVSGVLQPGGVNGSGHLPGVLCGLAAAVLYGAVTLMNKRLAEVPAIERSLVQLFTAGLVTLPYTLFCEHPAFGGLNGVSLVLLLTVGIFHTGVAFWLFFDSLPFIESQQVALLSYTDPVLTVLFSAFVFSEPMTWQTACGAVLILGSAILGEIPFGRAKTA